MNASNAATLSLVRDHCDAAVDCHALCVSVKAGCPLRLPLSDICFDLITVLVTLPKVQVGWLWLISI